MSNVFSKVSGIRPGRSFFDLSHQVLFDCNAGELIPILCEEMVPGDMFKIENEVVVRLQPLVAPMLHEVDITIHYFFVPYRILWSGWESFITGGVDGADVSVLPRLQTSSTPIKGTLWDYFGWPLVKLDGMDRPLTFPHRAYYRIFNEYYRDESLQEPISDEITTVANGGALQKRSWRKDYFTSALPWQQRGTAPALPVSGSTSAIWPDTDFSANGSTGAISNFVLRNGTDPKAYLENGGGTGIEAEAAVNLKNLFNHNTVSLASATSVNISELRLSVQIQKWMERNARAGVRYTEFLREHFGEAPRDDRLQRPEYIGGSKQPLIVSEVLKTSQDGTRPQGNLAGHGLSAAANRIAKYHAQEYGLVMGLMSIMPRAVYNSQGFDRQWLRRSKFDFYFPEFAHLSEQAIEREEIFATTVEADNRTIWGYQGRYDEMRVKRSRTARNMRDTLSYWSMARNFASAPALNTAFIQCDGSSDPTNNPLTKVFAVPTEPGYIVHIGNKVVASRPLPIASNPGMMDHF